MITALALAPPPPRGPTPAGAEDAPAEEGFAALFEDEGTGEAEAEEVLMQAFAGLPAPSAPVVETVAASGGPASVGAATGAQAPALPQPPAAAVPTDPPLPEATGEAIDKVAAPPSSEAALRLQMQDEGEAELADITPAPRPDSPEPAARATADSAALPPLAPAEAAPRSAAPHLPSQTAPDAPAHAPPARQAAEAIAQAVAGPSGSDRVELVLRPEELGRVRFELRSEGDRLVVTMTADRPETMDLLRRHLPELRAELEQAGYGAADLNFGQSGTPGGQSDRAETPATTDFAPLAAPTPPPRAKATGTGAGGLDLRL